MESRFNEWLTLNIFAHVRFSTGYTSLRGWKYQRGYKLLEIGDIVLIKDNWKLTALLVPGDFTHASLCVDKNSEFEIAEMTEIGFTKSCFFDSCKEADRVCIYRCKDWDNDYIQKVVAKCKSLDGTKYDCEFELGIKALYCSEMVVVSDFENRLMVNYDDLVGMGTEYISPNGLAMAKNVELIWDSDKEKRNN